MSEEIVREGGTRQGTIEGDYRESAQNYCLSPSKVFICRRSYLHPSSFWQGCPKTDQYLTKYLPHRLTRDAPKRVPRLLGRFFEQYFRYQMNSSNCFEQVNDLTATKTNRITSQSNVPNLVIGDVLKRLAVRDSLRSQPRRTVPICRPLGAVPTAGTKGASPSAKCRKNVPFD